MKKLHPGAKWIFRLNSYYFLIIIGFFLIGGISNVVELFIGGFNWIFFIFKMFFYVLFVIISAEIYSGLTYNKYLYEITPDVVKIENGIIWKKYTSIPYERIQNLDVRRGIIARIFGFSTIDIETAGQSGFGVSFRRRTKRKYQGEGHLPAVALDEAEKIRKVIMKRIGQTSDSSL